MRCQTMRQILAAVVVLLVGFVGPAVADDDVTIVAPASEAAEGLDLHAVSELFKEAENLEAFERSLNDPEVGVNNLDLDGNGEVDFIRVVEEVAGETHVIILQALLAEDEFQDVATIEIERSGDDEYNLQVHGNEVIYGPHYYVVPAHVHVHWPIVHWIYRPHYHPYRSAFYFGVHPHWWRPYRPVTLTVYRTRTVRYTTRATFSVTRTSRVRTVSKVRYTPRNSTRVTKRTAVAVGPGGVKAGRSVTTTKAGVKKTKNPRTGATTSVKKGTKKTTDGNARAKKTTKKKTAKKKPKKKGAKKTRKKKQR